MYIRILYVELARTPDWLAGKVKGAGGRSGLVGARWYIIGPTFTCLVFEESSLETDRR